MGSYGGMRRTGMRWRWVSMAGELNTGRWDLFGNSSLCHQHKPGVGAVQMKIRVKL